MNKGLECVKRLCCCSNVFEHYFCNFSYLSILTHFLPIICFCIPWIVFFCFQGGGEGYIIELLAINGLILFTPMLHFYTPWKRQKSKGFKTFSRGLEIGHWCKKGQKVLCNYYVNNSCNFLYWKLSRKVYICCFTYISTILKRICVAWDDQFSISEKKKNGTFGIVVPYTKKF